MQDKQACLQRFRTGLGGQAHLSACTLIGENTRAGQASLQGWRQACGELWSTAAVFSAAMATNFTEQAGGYICMLVGKSLAAGKGT